MSNGDARWNEIKLSKYLSQGRLGVASSTMIDVTYILFSCQVIMIIKCQAFSFFMCQMLGKDKPN